MRNSSPVEEFRAEDLAGLKPTPAPLWVQGSESNVVHCTEDREPRLARLVGERSCCVEVKAEALVERQEVRMLA